MKKRRIPLTGLTAYFHRKPRPKVTVVYDSTSSEDETLPNKESGSAHTPNDSGSNESSSSTKLLHSKQKADTSIAEPSIAEPSIAEPLISSSEAVIRSDTTTTKRLAQPKPKKLRSDLNL